MAAGTAHEIGDDEQVAPEHQDVAPMLEGSVAIVFALEVVERVMSAPSTDTTRGGVPPAERPPCNGLRSAVDHERVVHVRGAQAIAKGGVHRVATCTGIDEE